MFQSLSTKLTGVFDKIRGRGVIRDADLDVALREIRVALLEADVSLSIVKSFCATIKEKAQGADVIKSVSPGQMIVKIVHDELIALLKSDEAETELNINVSTPATILMVGLQGAGKTTTSGKLAGLLQKKNKKRVLLASLDIYRPAAREQLKRVGEQLSVDVLSIIDNESVEEITKRAVHAAKTKSYDVLILDTAGRLHIDEPLMQEVQLVKKLANPSETLLVVDSMTGQDAVNIAKSFEEQIGLTGIVLTRVDGDARGGAALSMRSITGRPIKFMGLGEKLDAIEIFDAQRIAGRILDMGDIVSLVEKAESVLDKDEAESMAKKMESGKFDMNDLAKQIHQMKKMGGLAGVMGMLPGIAKFKDKIEKSGMNDKEMDYQLAIIYSMTKQERRYPKLLNASRKKRIASGAGRSPQEINKLLKQYEQMSKAVKKMKKMGMKGMMRGGLGALMGR
ncbi:MAG: signal recognition particle protein [Alphaproteobacteria bacterium CG_4_10_14_0_8_um_filter_37_21]|nr:MAG: signal recognition particle protein [Alphaproteobacteria bacterium CG_4_10_14_0_8_um_filter_37_21]